MENQMHRKRPKEKRKVGIILCWFLLIYVVMFVFFTLFAILKLPSPQLNIIWGVWLAITAIAVLGLLLSLSEKIKGSKRQPQPQQDDIDVHADEDDADKKESFWERTGLNPFFWIPLILGVIMVLITLFAALLYLPRLAWGIFPLIFACFGLAKLAKNLWKKVETKVIDMNPEEDEGIEDLGDFLEQLGPALGRHPISLAAVFVWYILWAISWLL